MSCSRSSMSTAVAGGCARRRRQGRVGRKLQRLDLVEERDDDAGVRQRERECRLGTGPCLRAGAAAALLEPVTVLTATATCAAATLLKAATPTDQGPTVTSDPYGQHCPGAAEPRAGARKRYRHPGG